ncbi:MAG: hypothetical protein Q4G42_05345 [Neisseria sp.]|nr:hypothetical protein [Neisseria sp.]
MFRQMLAVAWLGVVLSSAAQAGCGEGKGQCSYYRAGQLVSSGACKVTVCAASDQYFTSTWQWEKGNNTVEISLGDPHKPFEERPLLLNGKPTFSLNMPFKNEDLSCFGIVGADEILCNDAGVF